MNKEQFTREYESIWISEKEYQKAYELWIMYQYHCEVYDKVICSGREDRNGFVKPKDNKEMILINKNAIKIADYIYNIRKELEVNGFIISNNAWEQARKDSNSLTWEGLRREYHRLNDTEGEREE